MADTIPPNEARQRLADLTGQRVRVTQRTLDGATTVETGILHYDQDSGTWAIRGAVVTYPDADVYVDPRHLVDVALEQRGSLWGHVHHALCEAGISEGYAEQFADQMLAALSVDDVRVVERVSQSRTQHPHIKGPLPCGATAPLHSGGEATCTRPAGHTTHIADNGARWTDDPRRVELAAELRRLAKLYGYPAIAAELMRQTVHIGGQP